MLLLGVLQNSHSLKLRKSLRIVGLSEPTSLQSTASLKRLCHRCFFFYFSIWVFFHDHSRITGLQGKGEGISLTPHYHFHPLHRHLDISRAITAESSHLHIASSRTRTGNLWFPSASRNRCYFGSFVKSSRRTILKNSSR